MIDFLGIGAQKAGTSWLYEQLSRHPRIAFPAGKEIHFWDRQEGRDPGEWLKLFEAAPPGVRQGEITPAYALLSESVVATLGRLCPDLRLFFSLRSPIDRAWSSALMALGRAELEYHEVSASWFLEHFHSAGSRGRGDYLTTLDRYEAVFPADQLCVLLFDDLVAAPRATLETLLDHILGPDEGTASFLATLDDARLQAPVRQGPGIPLPGPLRGELLALYRPSIEALAERLGRDLSHWLGD